MPAALRRLSAPATPVPRSAGASETLRGLIAGHLVTHEAIGDPDRLAGEAATLRALCRLVAGPIYRIAPFHYAFLARSEDLGGALAGLGAEARAQALAAALAAPLGAGALRILPAETPAETVPPLPSLRSEVRPAAPAPTDRFAPLEARLAALEAALAERTGQADLLARLDAAQAAQAQAALQLEGRLAALELPFDRLADEVARLEAAQKTGLADLAALGVRTEALEDRQTAEAAAGATATADLAERVARLEASLPRLTLAQALMMEALERQAAPTAPWPLPRTAASTAAETAADPAPDPAPAAAGPEDETFWRLPRVVSVHKM